MSLEEKTAENTGDFLSEWMKATSDLWESTFKMATYNRYPDDTVGGSENGAVEDENPWKTFYEFWQALSTAIHRGEDTKQDIIRPVTDIPLVAMQALQLLLAGHLRFPGLLGTGETEQITDIARKMNKVFSELYIKELKRILNMPQLGLTRYYQERAGRALDKFSEFQSTLVDFIQLLYQPMERTLRSLQEEIKNINERGQEILQDSKEFYKLWINRLEENYLAFLRSPEYGEAMRKTLQALHDYRVTREQLLLDLLQDLPIPTNRDMDGVYKDIYILKKRVKELENKHKGKRYEGREESRLERPERSEADAQ
ncbi:MAG TPA: poly(R)-hydroxyalkanoic acid synthase subunit PhaE [Syntrophales bacterium]|nr:poly(R)-hydroxyalkanoic acid synthase subunit PhaE [Syntrophales bacterium]HRT70715.1 poly(R)-hydroxyalkanoic acid synthase subunit PhaE [Syntrophales bacterium]